MENDDVEITEIPVTELVTEDISERNVERMARGFIVGSQAIGRRREVKAILEERVTQRIGTKGKYLVDKLFELIEGVYIVDKARTVKGQQDVRYYKVPPNLQAITYALDRVLGKPNASTPESEAKKGITIVEKIIKNLAGDTVEATRKIEIKE